MRCPEESLPNKRSWSISTASKRLVVYVTNLAPCFRFVYSISDFLEKKKEQEPTCSFSRCPGLGSGAYATHFAF
jgi:hypothetical protein